MDTTLEEYAIGVKGGLVTDPGEYQDAYGFTVVALKMSKRLSSDEAQGVTLALDALLALWPKGGPLAESKPAPVNDVKLKVEAALAAIRALP